MSAAVGGRATDNDDDVIGRTSEDVTGRTSTRRPSLVSVGNTLATDFPSVKDPSLRCVAHFFRVRSNRFEAVLSCIIMINLVLIIVEVDETAATGISPPWAQYVNLCLLLIYATELVVKITVYRKQFFQDAANILDVLIVVADIGLTLIEIVFQTSNVSVTVVRTLRLARLFRIFRVLRGFRELNKLIKGFIAAMKSTAWGMLMVAVVTLIWSVLAVQLLHPMNVIIWTDDESCDTCIDAYSSVWKACLTIFQQVVCVDDWGTLTRPLIEYAPLTGTMFFLGAFVSINLVILNLILAVIVDSAQESREEAQEQEEKEKETLFVEESVLHAKSRLLELCLAMSADGTSFSSNELLLQMAQDSSELSETLHALNASDQIVGFTLQSLDDGEGLVSCDEFVSELFELASRQTTQILNTVTEIKNMLKHEALCYDVLKERPLLQRSFARPHALLAADGQASFLRLQHESSEVLLQSLKKAQAEVELSLGSFEARLKKMLAPPSEFCEVLQTDADNGGSTPSSASAKGTGPRIRPAQTKSVTGELRTNDDDDDHSIDVAVQL
eukprot:TRINITY_DN65446_c0_g1_i1.p1 TRINITY_DN65446_c0_g1~~TRINITY_DN65446_c0_g1_i1.p1  ORF type:complete len:557 (+),score=114.41 TRINITY_DN65446_c0_g1_i1:80-1750(+)